MLELCRAMFDFGIGSRFGKDRTTFVSGNKVKYSIFDENLRSFLNFQESIRDQLDMVRSTLFGFGE